MLILEFFQTLNYAFEYVINHDFKGCNSNAGHFEAIINMSPVQPFQHK